MTTINVKVVDQTLKLTNTPIIASGGMNENKMCFEFCALWDGLAKVAVFYKDKNTKYFKVLDANNECIVPDEVLQEKGTFFFGVYGTVGTTRKTTELMAYSVVEGAIVEGVIAPTLDLYEQILLKYNEISTLFYANISNIEEAVNLSNEASSKVNAYQNNLDIFKSIALKRVDLEIDSTNGGVLLDQEGLYVLEVRTGTDTYTSVTYQYKKRSVLIPIINSVYITTANFTDDKTEYYLVPMVADHYIQSAYLITNYSDEDIQAIGNNTYLNRQSNYGAYRVEVDNTNATLTIKAGLSDGSKDVTFKVNPSGVYVDDTQLLTEKHGKGCNALKKAHKNLESACEGKSFKYQSDSTIAYTKNVPSGAMPYAILERVGGMCYVVDNEIQKTKITSVASGKQTITFTSDITMNSAYGLGIDNTYYNYIDLVNKKLVQMVKSVTLNGSEDWGTSTTQTSGVNRMRLKTLAGVLLAPSNNTNVAIAMTDKYETLSAVKTYELNEGFSIDNSGHINIYDSNYQDVDSFKTYLASNPITLIYALATPIETDISSSLTDEYIEVAEGDTITFNNTSGLAVPSTITYQVSEDNSITEETHLNDWVNVSTSITVHEYTLTSDTILTIEGVAGAITINLNGHKCLLELANQHSGFILNSKAEQGAHAIVNQNICDSNEVPNHYFLLIHSL